MTGTVNGDIDVMGQMIHIKKDAVVNGDIRAEWIQIIIIEGTVTGEVTGKFQVLDDRRANAAGAANPNNEMGRKDAENTGDTELDNGDVPASPDDEPAEVEPVGAQ